MRYKKLMQQKYFDAFSCYDPAKDGSLLKEFGAELGRYHVLMMMAEQVGRGENHNGFDENAVEIAEMWPDGVSLQEVAQSLKSKSAGGWIFKADPELLNSDEILLLLLHPFSSRMADSYEEEFAACGDLYRWLCLLKEKAEQEAEEKRQKTCCFTGHRPHLFPWQDESDPRFAALQAGLAEAIDQAIADGITHFICGGALGVDTWAASLVLKAKGKHPHIHLTVAQPWPDHNNNVEDVDYLWVKQLADRWVAISQSGGKEAFAKRDQWMVDHSGRIIVVYDDRSGLKGGTYETLEYAKQQKREIRQIKWMDF